MDPLDELFQGKLPAPQGLDLGNGVRRCVLFFGQGSMLFQFRSKLGSFYGMARRDLEAFLSWVPAFHKNLMPGIDHFPQLFATFYIQCGTALIPKAVPKP